MCCDKLQTFTCFSCNYGNLLHPVLEFETCILLRLAADVSPCVQTAQLVSADPTPQTLLRQVCMST